MTRDLQQLAVFFLFVLSWLEAMVPRQEDVKVLSCPFPVCLSHQGIQTITEGRLERSKVLVSHLVSATTFGNQRLGLHTELVVSLDGASTIEVHQEDCNKSAKAIVGAVALSLAEWKWQFLSFPPSHQSADGGWDFSRRRKGRSRYNRSNRCVGCGPSARRRCILHDRWRGNLACG